MSVAVTTINDADFDLKVLQADKPVLVDFWAEWCSPCRALTPILEEIAIAYQDRLTIFKLNIDENTQYATQFGVRSIPTLLLFKEGQLSATKIGAGSKSQMTAFIDSHL